MVNPGELLGINFFLPYNNTFKLLKYLDKCLLQSSICTPTNQNCEAIAVANGNRTPNRNASIFLLLIGTASFGLTFLFIVIYFKRFVFFKNHLIVLTL
jgi:hypothetical protein